MYTGPWNFAARQVLRLHQRTYAPFACCHQPMRVTRQGLLCQVCGATSSSVPASIMLTACRASIERHIRQPFSYATFWWLLLGTCAFVSSLLPKSWPLWTPFLVGMGVYFLVRMVWQTMWTWAKRSR